MTKASPIQTSFNAGEISPLLGGHIDLPKRGYALEECINMIPTVQGAIRRRAGSRFVSEVKDSDKAVRLETFKFSNDQSYTLELGDQYIRFYKDRGQILAPDKSIYEISTPYLEADLFQIKMDTQSADTLFITHPDYPMSKLVRYADDDWRLEVLRFDGPFLPGNPEASGVELISNGGFDSNLADWEDKSTENALIQQDEGQLRLISPNGFGIAQQQITIDSTTSAHELKIKINRGLIHIEIGTTNRGNDILKVLNLAPGTHTINVPATGTSTIYLSLISDWRSWTDPARIDWVSLKSIGTRLKLISTAGYTKGTPMELKSDGNEIFQEGHATSLWKLKDGANEVDVQTLTYIDETTLLVQPLSNVPAPLQNIYTGDWYEGLYNGVNGYPSCSTFFQDRLVFGGAKNYPQRLDFSRSGNYDSFRTKDSDGVVVESHSIAITINSSTINTIFWIKDNEKGLLVGTDSSEFVIRASTLGEKITPDNTQYSKVGSYGSSNITPEESNNTILFVQRGGRKLRELAYTFTTDGFSSPDMTILAEHITESGIKQIAFQIIPNNILWCVRNDGVLLGFTYERTEQVVAWHRHILGGEEAKVESVAITPYGVIEDVWIVVKRKINGVYKKHIEYITPEFTGEYELADTVLSDSVLSHDGEEKSIFTGLDHLEGETVQIMADGYAHKDMVVSGGSITLDIPASKVHIGLSNTWKITTLPIEAGAKDGIAQSKSKRIHNFTLRVFKSLGIYHKRPKDDEIYLTDDTGYAFNQPTELFSGDNKVPNVAGNDTYGQIVLTGDKIFPVCILAIMPQVVTNDAR